VVNSSKGFGEIECPPDRPSRMAKVKAIKTIIDGKTYIIEPRTGLATLIPDDGGSLKDEGGHYKPEVVAQCWQMYMQGISYSVIAKRSGVPHQTISRWACGTGVADKNCWNFQKKEVMEGLVEETIQMRTQLAKHCLQKMIDHVASDEAKCGSLDDAMKFAEIFKKTLNTEETRPAIELNLVTRMSADEALEVLIKDPGNQKPTGNKELDALIAPPKDDL